MFPENHFTLLNGFISSLDITVSINTHLDHIIWMKDTHLTQTYTLLTYIFS